MLMQQQLVHLPLTLERKRKREDPLSSTMMLFH